MFPEQWPGWSAPLCVRHLWLRQYLVPAWLFVATAACHCVVEVNCSTVGFVAEKATVIVTGALAALVLAVWALVSSVAAALAAVWAVSTSVWPLSTEISLQVRHGNRWGMEQCGGS